MQKPRGFLVPCLSVVAAAGWGWGIYQNASIRSDGGESVAENVQRRSGERQNRSATSGASIAALLPTQRSAQLLARLDQIAAGRVAGQVNEKLIAATHEALLDPDYPRRSRDFALLLELMGPEDAVAVHELMLELHREGRGFGWEYGAFAARWGEVDPVGALKYLMNEVPMRLPAHDFSNLVRGWAQKDPAAAMQWLEQHPDIAESRGGWSAVVNGWMRTDPQAATNYLLSGKVPDHQVIDSIRYAALEKLFSTGKDEAVDWLASLPEGDAVGFGARNAWGALAWEMTEVPYDTAAKVWGQVGSKSWMGFHEFARFCESTGNTRVADRGQEGFLEALQATWPPEAAARQFERWQQQNPAAVDAWLTRFDGTQFVEAVRAEMGR